MSNRLAVVKDVNGNVIYGLPFAVIGYETTLAPSTAQSLTVPGDAEIALFSYSSGIDVFVDPVTTAAIPGGSFAATTADLNPVMRLVTPGKTLSFISAEAGYVKVSFYTLLASGLV